MRIAKHYRLLAAFSLACFTVASEMLRQDYHPMYPGIAVLINVVLWVGGAFTLAAALTLFLLRWARSVGPR